MKSQTCVAERHGTRYAYQKGCRCPDAVEANRSYARNYWDQHHDWLNSLKQLAEKERRQVA